jgi:hypothetical protein
VRASRAMTQLAILAAEDAALSISADALDALRAAMGRTDATASAGFAAAAEVAGFAEHVAAARIRAWDCWTEVLVPLLTDAGVLHVETRPPLPTMPPRTWTTGTVLPAGSAMTYPARIAARRRVAGNPVIRLDVDTCRRLAADVRDTSCPVPPTILVDRDRPVVVLGAADLDHAWRADAAMIYADADGFYTLTGDGWLWRTGPSTDASGRRAHSGVRHISDPAQSDIRRTSLVSVRAAHLRLVTT